MSRAVLGTIDRATNQYKVFLLIGPRFLVGGEKDKEMQETVTYDTDIEEQVTQGIRRIHKCENESLARFLFCFIRIVRDCLFDL